LRYDNAEMKKKTSYTILFLVLILLASSSFFEAGPPTKAKDAFLSSMEALRGNMIAFKKNVDEARTEKALQAEFKKLRISYKKCELFLSYFSPLTESAINGPNIHSVEEERFPEEESPHGFQVIEEILFPNYDPGNKDQLINEVDRLLYNIDQFLRFKNSFVFQPQFAFDAMEQEIIRISVLGITGFDSPVLNYSLVEASTALSSVKRCVQVYASKAALKSSTFQSLQQQIDRALEVLKKSSDFNSFDRLAFIKGHGIPIYRRMVKLRKEWKVPQMNGIRPTRQNVENFWSADFFDPNYFAQDSSGFVEREKEILGKKLFFDPLLSGNGKRSCATCHDPQKAFTDGLTKSMNIDGASHTSRNAPTLFNSGFQTFFFLDMRARSLEAQLDTVLNNKFEMGSSLDETVRRIAANPAYVELFNKSFPGENAVSGFNLKNALAVYVRSLASLNSGFDQFMVHQSKSIGPDVYNGFNLFMGKAKCGTCHFAPLFNGLVPPRFVKMEAEVIGVPSTTDTLHPELDPDPGRFGILPVKAVRNAFKTTTVRNISLTAPYMHNGVYVTLEEVMDFYNKGGGAGLGIAPDHQTLPFDKLNLSEKEKKDIITFMRSLNDTAAANR